MSAAGAAVDGAGAAVIVRHLGLSGRAYVKRRGGRSYLILKGNPGQRPSLRGTRYLASNPRVAHLTVGPRALARGAARMTGIAVVAYTGLRVVEAILRQEDVRLVSLLGSVGADVTKFAIAAGAGFLAGAAVGAITMLAAGPLIAAVFVGVATSVTLDRIDREFGLTEKLVRALESMADRVPDPLAWLASEITRWERHLIQRAIQHSIP